MYGRGKFDEIIEIWSTYNTKNEFGEEEHEYNFRNFAKAHVRYDSGERLIENNEVIYTYVRRFEIADYVDVDEYDRIKYKHKFYRILNIQPIKKDRILIIQCELIND